MMNHRRLGLKRRETSRRRRIATHDVRIDQLAPILNVALYCWLLALAGRRPDVQTHMGFSPLCHFSFPGLCISPLLPNGLSGAS